MISLKYRVRIALRKAVGIFKGDREVKVRHISKPVKVFIGFGVVIALVLTAWNFGFGGGKGFLKTSAESGVTNNYNYSYDGISIHTKVVGPDGKTATVKKGNGEVAVFTLTVSNPGTENKNTDVKFTMPPGFSFKKMVYPSSLVPKKDSCGGGLFQEGDQGVMYWCGYSATVGSSEIVFETKVP